MPFARRPEPNVPPPEPRGPPMMSPLKLGPLLEVGPGMVGSLPWMLMRIRSPALSSSQLMELTTT